MLDNRVMEKHTDLAIEVRESFPEDSVEIDGGMLGKAYFGWWRTFGDTCHY